MKTRLFIAALGLCGTLGCGLTEPDHGLRLVVLGQPSATTTSFVAVNQGNRTFYVPRCGDRLSVAVEKRVSEGWVNAAAALCLAVERMDPITLDPGASFESFVGITGPGIFRLHTGKTESASSEMTFDLYSAPFEIK